MNLTYTCITERVSEDDERGEDGIHWTILRILLSQIQV